MFDEGAEMAGTLQEVTDINFQAEVLESEGPVLVDFWAPWCGPCRVVAPVLEEIAQERQDLRIVKLNIDDNQATAAQFEVLSIPTMILFKNGAVAKKVIGAYPKKRLEAELEPELA
jgi:thioredoxin 1